MGFATNAIHIGQEPDPATGAIVAPIYQTSTYIQEGLGRNKGYEYARTQNPTRAALEANLAALERGKNGHCFASGMSAIDVALRPAYLAVTGYLIGFLGQQRVNLESRIRALNLLADTA